MAGQYEEVVNGSGVAMKRDGTTRDEWWEWGAATERQGQEDSVLTEHCLLHCPTTSCRSMSKASSSSKS